MPTPQTQSQSQPRPTPGLPPQAVASTGRRESSIVPETRYVTPMRYPIPMPGEWLIGSYEDRPQFSYTNLSGLSPEEMDVAREGLPCAYLLSIWPLDERFEFRRPVGTIELTGVTDSSEYRVFRIYDSVDYVRPWANGRDATNANEFQSETEAEARIVAASLLVDDIIGRASLHGLDADQHARPGMLRILRAQPSEKELMAVYEMQRAYAQRRINEADKAFASNRRQDVHSTIDPAMARWLGDVSTENHPWLTRSRAAATKPCPVCVTGNLPVDAIKCMGCQADLVQYYEQIAIEIPAEHVDAHLRAILLRRQALRQQAAQAQAGQAQAPTAQPAS